MNRGVTIHHVHGFAKKEKRKWYKHRAMVKAEQKRMHSLVIRTLRRCGESWATGSRTSGSCIRCLGPGRLCSLEKLVCPWPVTPVPPGQQSHGDQEMQNLGDVSGFRAVCISEPQHTGKSTGRLTTLVESLVSKVTFLQTLGRHPRAPLKFLTSGFEGSHLKCS